MVAHPLHVGAAMSNGTGGLRGYQEGDLVEDDPNLLQRAGRWLQGGISRLGGSRDFGSRRGIRRSPAALEASDRSMGGRRFERVMGLPTNQAELEKMMPLLDSLQHMLTPSPGGAGYSESGEVPVSFRPGDPQIASGEALGVYHSPQSGMPENITLKPGDSDLRFTAAHEFGHSIDFRDPKGKTGWLSPALREAIYSRTAPFDTEGRHGTGAEHDAPYQRIADYIGDAIMFLQTSKDPTIDPAYTRQFLSDRPHLQKVTEGLLQLPIYQEHPLLTGSLGDAYEPEVARASISQTSISHFTPAQKARIGEMTRDMDLGFGVSFQEGDTDAMWDAVGERLDKMTGPRYRSSFRRAPMSNGIAALEVE